MSICPTLEPRASRAFSPMFVILLLLSYLAPGTLACTIPPISSLISDTCTEAGIYPHNGPSALLLPFSRDVSTYAYPSDQRSLWYIVRTCVATIFLCAWVSVHPDVPAHGEKWWRSIFRRMEYMFWTLMAPEMIICWASRQWAGARRIRKAEEGLGWTVTHGHFVQMGGFMLFKGGERLGTLSYERLVALHKQGRIEFPEITQEEIEDKSKSGGLSKAIVVAQIRSFVLQCIEREVRGLSFTELELSTLASSALNEIMLFFWWNKPFGVRCPVRVVLISDPEVSVPEPTLYDESMTSLELSPAQRQLESAGRRDFPEFDRFRTLIVSRSGWGKLITWPWIFILFVGHRLRDMNEDEDKIRAFDVQPEETEEDTTGPMNVPTFYSLLSTNDNSFYAAVFLLSLLYGFIHCFAWPYHFPTSTELWLWRVSSVVIGAIPVVAMLIICFVTMMSSEDRPPLYNLTVLIFYLGLTMYVVARLIILAESISTLRDLPPDAYNVAKWTSSLPHI